MRTQPNHRNDPHRRHRDLKQRLCPVLVERSPRFAPGAAGHEIVGHGYRWLDYLEIDEAVEREHIRLGVEGIEKLTGQAPEGMQIEGAKLGGIFNMGGAAVANYVSILEPAK